ncbi:unnamed protein product [Paramecium primaurelia]|uniref:Uncharacterized protein n=1 Tax=Paramecium primaurelia TaxID=5886 RepID=A0A8S1QS76_PARPR|nr:unnamed protein product [Paramecium primaurelia]
MFIEKDIYSTASNNHIIKENNINSNKYMKQQRKQRYAIRLMMHNIEAQDETQKSIFFNSLTSNKAREKKRSVISLDNNCKIKVINTRRKMDNN